MMKKHVKPLRLVSIVLLIFALVSLCACGIEQKSLVLTTDEIAKNVADSLKKDWDTLQHSQSEMGTDDGTGFLADLNGDGIPELFWAYSGYKTGIVLVYDISGAQVVRLGSFHTSPLSTDLTFKLYKNKNGNMLYTKAVLPDGTYGPNYVTEAFVFYVDSRLEAKELYSIEPSTTLGSSSTQEIIYFGTLNDGVPITKTEYTKERTAIMKGSSLSETFIVPKEAVLTHFLEADRMEKAIAAALSQWQATLK